MSTLPTPRLWVLGWLAEREYFIDLARELNLCKEPKCNDRIKLEAAAIHHVVVKTWWPNLMECVVDGTDELVFAVYVDYKRRPYPPQAIPGSALLPRKYCDRLEAWIPLDKAPQWFTCDDRSYTSRHYARHEPNVKDVWLDMSRYRPHPGADYDHLDEDAEAEGFYDEELGPGAMDADGGGQEYLDDPGYVEEYSVEEGNHIDGEYVTDGASFTSVAIASCLLTRRRRLGVQ